jgi:hypothetical protein
MVKLYKYFSIFTLVLLISCKKAEENKLFKLRKPGETGVIFSNQLKETIEKNIINYQDFYSGGGVSLGDINNDGLTDIFFTGNMVENQLYLNKGDFKFEEISKPAKIQDNDYNWCTGSTMVDINHDGWLDIYVSYSGLVPLEQRRNKLWVNQQDGTFTDEAKKYGIDDPGYAVNANFFDFDKDGDLDMYLVNQGPEKNPNFNMTVSREVPNEYCGDKLYRNDDGKFIEITKEAGIYSALIGFGHGAAVGDVNNDGWDDIFVCNDFFEHDYLYINNQDGTFSEELKKSMKHISNFSMGNDMADFNNDGFLDIMVVDMIAEDYRRQKAMMSGMNSGLFWRAYRQGYHYQYMANMLHRNNGNGTFSEIAHMAGISHTDWSWGPLLADFDGDGLKDLFVPNGLKKDIRNRDWAKLYNDLLDDYSSYELFSEEIWNRLLESLPSEKIPNYMYKNNGDLTFKNITHDWGLDQPSFSNGAAYGDLDNDGDLDLVVNNVDDPAFIYENLSNEKEDYRFLKIRLIGPEKNPYALGTKIELTSQSGQYQKQQLYLTRGYRSSMEPSVIFGCGSDSIIQKLNVIWPDNTISELKNLKTNQVIILNYKDASEDQFSKPAEIIKIFKNELDLSVHYEHKENVFDPYQYQPLLPFRLSELGPYVDAADVNGDGLDDFFIGGLKGNSGHLFLQKTDGSFMEHSTSFWYAERLYEDMGILFFDVDNDVDQDLYISSGGYEEPPNAEKYRDRLYLNDGQGNFDKTSDLPAFNSSSGKVIPGDYDEDGDLDLLVLGRQVPQKYPLPADSYILRNDDGVLIDITEDVAPELIGIGMATDAVWTDYDVDGDLDFIVVGEWMKVTPFENDNGKFKLSGEINGLEYSSGWWNCIEKGDFDGDGDEDYVAGNLGLNYRYKTSREFPFQVFASDFNEDSRQDLVLAYYEDEILLPVENLERSILQIPELGATISSHDQFGEMTLKDIYQELALDKALNLKVFTFYSSYIENLGNGQFALKTLPNQAQISNINDVLVNDYDGDGTSDIVVAGNLYSSEAETVRIDAGIGLLLTNNGAGNFTAIPSQESGLFIDGDVKDLVEIKIDGSRYIMAARNGASLSFNKLMNAESQ